MKNRPHLAAVLFSLFGIMACDTGVSYDGVVERVELQRFESCTQLTGYLQKQAQAKMELYLTTAMRGGGYHGGGGADAGMAMSDSGSSSQPSTPSDPKSHTETNNQVKGADEPDFVKNDGTRIFVLSGNTLYLSRSWPANQLSLVGSIKIEGSARQMLLDGSKVMVFSAVSTGSNSSSCPGCSYLQNGITKITTIDVSKLDAPRVLRELFLPGSYKAARRVGASVRVVFNDNINWPGGLKWYPDYKPGQDYSDISWREEAYRQLMRKNARLIKEHPLADWLPEGYVKEQGGKKTPHTYSCGDFYRPNASVELGLVTVLSLDLDKPHAAPGRTSILGKVDMIYANQSSLYLANRHWWRSINRPTDSRDHTYLHKFDIKDIKSAKYVASGGVEGSLLNQFAMDEHKGFMRLATTRSEVVKESSNGWSTTEPVNRITVLAEKAGRLEEVGKSKDLARSERIYSARFMGDRGYLVTFRQVDPLYTMDLSNPYKPRVVGELKIPGYSSYIHPVGKNHLLAMGMHIPAPGTGSWQDRALKLSIFDVSNFSSPKETLSYKIGSVYGRSEALSEHKAFNFYSERNLLAIPFSDWDYSKSGADYWKSFVSELKVFKVDVNNASIKEVGALSMADMFEKKYGSNKYGYYYGYNWWVRRSVMATDQQNSDFLYAISDVGIRVSSLSSPATVLAEAGF